MAIAEPGYFHRLGIAAGADQGVGQWLRSVLGAQVIPTSMRQVHGMPFGEERTDGAVSDESGAQSEMLWLAGTPIALFIATDDEGMLGRYVARYGTGYHSVAWTIDDMWGAQIQLERAGVRITGIDLPGRHYFLHPGDTSGLLIELTDTEFTDDPRDGELPPRPTDSVVTVDRLAWLTVVVSDAVKTVASLSEILELTEVAGLPRDTTHGDSVVDVRLNDVIIRFVSPTGPDSDVAEFAAQFRQRMHSMCLAVPDLNEAVRQLGEHGIAVKAHNGGTAWTEPSTTLGLNIQWVQTDSLPDPA